MKTIREVPKQEFEMETVESEKPEREFVMKAVEPEKPEWGEFRLPSPPSPLETIKEENKPKSFTSGIEAQEDIPFRPTPMKASELEEEETPFTTSQSPPWKKQAQDTEMKEEFEEMERRRGMEPERVPRQLAEEEDISTMKKEEENKKTAAYLPKPGDLRRGMEPERVPRQLHEGETQVLSPAPQQQQDKPKGFVNTFEEDEHPSKIEELKKQLAYQQREDVMPSVVPKSTGNMHTTTQFNTTQHNTHNNLNRV